MPDNIKQLIPKNSLAKNAAEFADEIRKDNVESCFLAYRRKDGSGMRSFQFPGSDEAKYYFMLSVAVNDCMTAYTESDEITEYHEEDDAD